jgi:hypothetical protein
MRYCCAAIFVAFCALLPVQIFGSAELMSPNITVGNNLQTTARVTLNEPAPKGGLEITVTSDDPRLLLLSSWPEGTGTAWITVRAEEGQKTTRDIYLHGLADHGTVTYTVSAAGLTDSKATVTLAPSGVVIKGPVKFGDESFSTTAGPFGKSKIGVYSVLLDPALNFVSEQPVAGGRTLSVNVTSSDPLVGTISDSPVTIAGGLSGVTTYFQPKTAGNTTLAVAAPHGFNTPEKLASITAIVKPPAIAITSDAVIGQNLQSPATVSLGQPAPKGGITVTLTSNDPSQLLLAPDAATVGSKSITITIPPGSFHANYLLQALGNSGTATYTATAPGYESRTAPVQLTPSGVLIGYRQPPDEAEFARKESAQRLHGFVTKLSANDVEFTLYTAQLDPQTHRGADITVQPLRPGVSVQVHLQSSNPSVGTVSSPVTISAGSSTSAPFKPLSPGKTVVSIDTPAGFTTPGNATAFEAIVRD